MIITGTYEASLLQPSRTPMNRRTPHSIFASTINLGTIMTLVVFRHVFSTNVPLSRDRFRREFYLPFFALTDLFFVVENPNTICFENRLLGFFRSCRRRCIGDPSARRHRRHVDSDTLRAVLLRHRCARQHWLSRTVRRFRLLLAQHAKFVLFFLTITFYSAFASIVRRPLRWSLAKKPVVLICASLLRVFRNRLALRSLRENYFLEQNFALRAVSGRAFCFLRRFFSRSDLL